MRRSTAVNRDQFFEFLEPPGTLPPLEYWSRAITRIGEARKCVDPADARRLQMLQQLEELAYNCLSEEIARHKGQECQPGDQEKV